MTIILLAFVLTGIAVGLRFKVLMVLPVIVAGMFFTGAISLANGDHIGATLAAVVLNSIGIQVGYLCGTYARAVLRDTRTSEPTKAASTRTAQAFNVQVGANAPAQFVD
jgi:uncharacterized membrane protein